MRTLFVLIALCPLLLGCGSSDGSGTGGLFGPGTDPALFTGDFTFVAYAGRSRDSDSTYVDWGLLNSDASFVSGLKTRNEWDSAMPTADSQITPGLTVGPFAFLTGVSRRVIIEAELCLDGALAMNDNVAVFSAQRQGDDPAIAAAVRPGTGFDDGSLRGTYHLVGITHNHAPQGRTVLAGTVVFDGSGNATVNFTPKTDGVVGTPLASPATYALTGDGSLTLTIAAAQMHGALTPDRQVAILGGNATAAVTERQFLVLVQASTAAAIGLFNGTYCRVSLSSVLPSTGSGWTGLREVSIADGLGKVDRTQRLINGDGLLIRFADILRASYTVAPDGAFDGGVSGGVGGITPDGDVAAVVSLGASLTPRLDLLVRTAGP